MLACKDKTPRIRLKLNYGSGKSMFVQKLGYKVYFKHKADTYADVLGFNNVNVPYLDSIIQTLTN